MRGVQHDTDLTLLLCLILGTVQVHGGSVSQDSAVGDGVRILVAVGTVDGRAQGLVEGEPGLHTITEIVEQHLGIVAKPARKSLGIHERVREIGIVRQGQRSLGMVNSDVRINTMLNQLVNQVIVIVNARLIDRSNTGRHDSVPSDAEAVVLNVHLRHQLNILGV